MVNKDEYIFFSLFAAVARVDGRRSKHGTQRDIAGIPLGIGTLRSLSEVNRTILREGQADPWGPSRTCAPQK